MTFHTLHSPFPRRTENGINDAQHIEAVSALASEGQSGDAAQKMIYPEGHSRG
jgi:hypothetical protein